MIKQKFYLLPKKLDQLSNLNVGFVHVTFDWYLFQLIALLKPDFNCCNKVTTETLRFLSLIVNTDIWSAIGASIIYQSVEQVRIRLISRLINGISRVLQKLLKYFNGTIILTSFVPLFPILPAIFVLNLIEILLWL